MLVFDNERDEIAVCRFGDPEYHIYSYRDVKSVLYLPRSKDSPSQSFPVDPSSIDTSGEYWSIELMQLNNKSLANITDIVSDVDRDMVTVCVENSDRCSDIPIGSVSKIKLVRR